MTAIFLIFEPKLENTLCNINSSVIENFHSLLINHPPP